jgi:5'-nucleotidase
VQAVIDTAAAQIAGKLATVIGNTEVDLDGERSPGVRTKETNLGDYVADALLWQAKQANGQDVDAAIQNGGGIRASIPAGEITMMTLTTVSPYNNALAIVQLSGTQLLEIIEASTFCLPEAAASLPQVAGISYSVDTGVPYANGEAYPNSTYYAPAAPGARVTITDVGGKGFEADAVYAIAVSDFLANGGDTYYAMAQAYWQTGFTIGYTDTEALINYMQTALGGRIGQDYAGAQGRFAIN